MLPKDVAKSPEQGRAEWLGRKNGWCNEQPWRPLNAHVEAVVQVMRRRSIEADCLAVLIATTEGSTKAIRVARRWNTLIEEGTDLEKLTEYSLPAFADIIAGSYDINWVRDTDWEKVIPGGNALRAKRQLLLAAAEIMAGGA